MNTLARLFCMLALLAGLTTSPTPASAGDLDSLSWSVQYMIDNSQTVLGVNQSDRPRNNRGLAISPDNKYLYAGYNNPSGGYAVRKIDLSKPDYTDATLVQLTAVSRGKAIAVDDVGRVYLADSTAIKVYDANLTTLQQTITVSGSALEGVALAREGGTLALYNSNRNTGQLTKRILTESGGAVTGSSLDATFGTGGSIDLGGSAANLRGVEVDSIGRIWVAGYGSNTVYVVAPGGGSAGSISVHTPIDIGFYGGEALVTRSLDLLISRFNLSDLGSAGADLTAPLAGLELTATPATGGNGALEGIAVLPGLGFFLTGDGVNTANAKSTYGRVDGQSGWLDGKFYTDLYADDNDPILFAQVPEPASLLALFSGIGGVVLLRRRR